MTSEYQKSIINSKEVPKDNNDSIFNISTAIFFPLIILAAGIAPFFSVQNNANQILTLTFLITGFSLLFYTIYNLITDRKIELIETGLNKKKNSEIIQSLIKNEKWKQLNYSDEFFTLKIDYLLPNFTFDGTLIALENGILINVRKRYTDRGRLPYKIGLTYSIKKKIKTMYNNG